ncbi:MAG TPA: hypothetical protein VFA24_07580 [Gaiellaceae bacterium]|nr:hypothetical protein [Gaiellaceae bacterium]
MRSIPATPEALEDRARAWADAVARARKAYEDTVLSEPAFAAYVGGAYSEAAYADFADRLGIRPRTDSVFQHCS